MANSSGLFEFGAPFELAAFDPGRSQPTKTSMIAAAMVN
jgi:hypothetical protein